jgi:hypothetical protein
LQTIGIPAASQADDMYSFDTRELRAYVEPFGVKKILKMKALFLG